MMKDKSLMRRRLIVLAVGVIGLSSCRTPLQRGSPLEPEEKALVDLYVQITKIEALRAEEPDSVGPMLDRLGKGVDSTAVRSALAGLEKDPSRWALVYDEIARQLHALEESTDARAARPDAPAVPRIKD
jgi:hypothetical protein